MNWKSFLIISALTVVLHAQTIQVNQGGTGATTAAGALANLGGMGPVANVLNFGADPTGATDSTAAIQSAINSLSSTGGTVYIPRGNYKNSGLIAVTGVSLRGDPPQVVAYPISGGLAPDLSITPAGGTWIDCTSVNCLTGSALRGVGLHDIGFKNWSGYAISMGSNNVDGISFSNWSDLYFVGINTINSSQGAIQLENFQHITTTHVVVSNVNVCMNLVNINGYWTGGNSVFTNTFCAVAGKSVASGNNTYPGVELQVLTPSSGANEGLNDISFYGLQVNAFLFAPGDGTATQIQAIGQNNAGGYITGLRIDGLDLEAAAPNAMLYNVYLNYVRGAHIHYNISNNATYDFATGAGTIQNEVDCPNGNTTGCVVAALPAGNDTHFYGDYSALPSGGPMLGQYNIVNGSGGTAPYLSGMTWPTWVTGYQGGSADTKMLLASGWTATINNPLCDDGSGGVKLCGVTGTGAAVLNTSPTLTTPNFIGATFNSGVGITGNQGTGLLLQHSTGATTSGHLTSYDANGNTVDSGIATTVVPRVGTPIAGHAACIKSTGPVVIGYCSTVVDVSGNCTCN